MRHLFLVLLLSSLLSFGQSNADWTTPIPPFQVAPGVYYVGSRDLASYLLTTTQGNILINANLESSPPQIQRSVEKLGFHWKDIKILLNNQAHFDHVGGAAQILKETGARNYVMEGDVDVMESGGAKSFDLPDSRFPATKVDRVLHDGDEIKLGDTTVTALRTAGHTRGCTTFTFHVNEQGKDLLVVIVGGWSSNPGVRYTDAGNKPASYPGIAKDFQHTFATYENLRPDIFLGAHGGYFNMLQKLKEGARENQSMWVDPKGYAQAIAEAKANFQKKLTQEESTQPSGR